MSTLDTQLNAALNQALDGVTYDALRARVSAVSARYRAEQVDDTTLGMADDLDCLAYAVFRMPATYAAIRSALLAADAHVGAFATHLDLGGGTGSAAWAAAGLWPGISTEIVERQPSAIRLGRRLSATLANSNHRWISADLRHWTSQRRVDLISIAYVLNELSDATRHRLITTAAESADTVVVVEPGTPRGFHRILETRRHLMEHDLTIAAPCPHQHLCPLTTPDWCHFAVRLPRTELHRLTKHGTRNYEDEKFTYLVATRAPIRPARSRIITRPAHPKGQVLLDVCGSTGTRERLVVGRSAEEYRAARGASWGDVWPPLTQ
ncbi:small ribosomal subunit Rsm22 family protein [Kribbella sp. NPDC023972]|uniref:small ribosomal subunit Rsm22 family protein n=1 Tax=Kribbella sp. NPDC023972 TaxID=3154795 RepID=UPI0033D0338A